MGLSEVRFGMVWLGKVGCGEAGHGIEVRWGKVR